MTQAVRVCTFSWWGRQGGKQSQKTAAAAAAQGISFLSSCFHERTPGAGASQHSSEAPTFIWLIWEYSQAGTILKEKKKKKFARSEHTFREWSQTFKGQKLPLYCISLSNSSIVKNQCKTTSRGILLAFKLAYLPWNQCSKTMFPFSPFPTVLFSLPWDEFFSLLFFI